MTYKCYKKGLHDLPTKKKCVCVCIFPLKVALDVLVSFSNCMFYIIFENISSISIFLSLYAYIHTTYVHKYKYIYIYSNTICFSLFLDVYNIFNIYNIFTITISKEELLSLVYH